jgi:hypothetical protein
MQTNLYRALIDLLPQPTLQVAAVTATHTDGTVTVEYPGGSTQRVRGEAAVGQKVFVRAEAVEGVAPSLPVVDIEV